MHVIRVRNVHQALPEGVYELISKGIPSPSRYGDVLVHPEPVTTVYEKPRERVLFWPQRDANPFLHLFESLWMLAGRNDIEYVAQFAKQMRSFSDDGVTQHAAYGHRWKNHFQIGTATPAGAYSSDQLEWALRYLTKYPKGRRCVISMWDPEADIFEEEEGHKDVPCNTQLYLWLAQGAEGTVLNMTVTCRSNDMVWGAYGANAVHFSMLQEYMASSLCVGVGRFYQISNNFHAYPDTFEPVRCLHDAARDPYRVVQNNPYATKHVSPYALMIVPRAVWDRDLRLFMEDPYSNGFEDPFFHRVAKPMWAAHAAYRKKDDARFTTALEVLMHCEASDWGIAAAEWLERRMTKALAERK